MQAIWDCLLSTTRRVELTRPVEEQVKLRQVFQQAASKDAQLPGL